MNGLIKTTYKKEVEEEFSFKNYFIPLTTAKAITWIIIVGLIVYLNVLFNGFVWDDLTFVINNNVTHIFNLASLFGLNSFNTGGYYRPIPAVYFSLLWNLFGNMAFFYHFVQIILHIICACLIFIFLKRYLSRPFSFILTLIFLIHPIQVESVAYIGATQSELLLLAGLCAFLIGTKEKQNGTSQFLTAVFLLLALLTKETAFLFIVLLLLYHFLFQRNRVFRSSIYAFCSVIIYLFIRFVYAKDFLEKNITNPIGTLSFTQRLFDIPAVIFYYVKTFLFPAVLSTNQRWIVTAPTLQQFYFPLVVDIFFFFILGLGAFNVYKQNKKLFTFYLFFFVWFVLGLGIHSQIFPLDMTVADRWFYFPMVGILGMIGIFFELTLKKWQTIKKIVIYCILLILLLLSIRTVVRNANWQNELTLFSHDSKISDNYDIESTLATDYYKNKDYLIAAKHYEILVNFDPEAVNLANLGYIDTIIGKKQKAINAYARALSAGSHYYAMTDSYKEITYMRYAYLLLEEKEYIKAMSVLTQATVNYPKDTALWMEMAYLQNKLNNRTKALQAANIIKQLFPGAEADMIYSNIKDGKDLILNKMY